ncbi:MAG: hypothetical protein ACTSQI_07800 [Candidatus Helarchaeota archaeon]
MKKKNSTKKAILNWRTGECYLCNKTFKGYMGLFSHTHRSKEHKKRIHQYHQAIGKPCYICKKLKEKVVLNLKENKTLDEYC